MKNILFSMLFILIFCASLYADEIYSKDNKIIKCRIIRVTDKNIEYSETDGKAFLIMPRDSAVKIVYENGETFKINEENTDRIYLKDGKILTGKIIQSTDDVVIYIQEGADKKSVILLDNVEKIVYAKGDEKEISAQVEEKPIIHTGGFIDSIFRISLSGGAGPVWGNLSDKEHTSKGEYLDQVPVYYPVYPSDSKELSHSEFSAGIEACLMLPAIKIPQSRRFGLIGIKFGLIGSYIYSEIEQDLFDRGLPDDDYAGTLLKYSTVKAGPEMNLIFSPQSNRVNMVMRFYALGGYIHTGEITAMPGLRDAGLSIDKSLYSSDFTGYSITGGTGIRFVNNGAFPLIVGFDIQFTHTEIKFDNSIPVYNNADKTSFNDISFIFSCGIFL
jgi:hypothetical protein